MRKLLRDNKGVAAIEFAIVAPVLIVLMAVSFTIGSMQMAKQAVMFATQQAAVVQSTGGDVQAIFAQNIASTPASNATVTCNTNGSTATCTGTTQFANVFAGVLGTPATVALTYTAAVQVPS
jgi:Flp pilus assembly protein TadG